MRAARGGEVALINCPRHAVRNHPRDAGAEVDAAVGDGVDGPFEQEGHAHDEQLADDQKSQRGRHARAGAPHGALRPQ
eukprot:scaffold21090_cov73-Isochrysis_galbana.AAC.1